MFLKGISFSIVVCMFLLIASYHISRHFYKKVGLFNPLSIFFGAWFVALFLYELDAYFGFFRVRMSMQADVCLAISFLCFFVGYFISITLNNYASATLAKVYVLQDNIKYVWYINIILFVVFSLATLSKYFIITAHFGNFYCAMTEVKQSAIQGEFKFPFFFNFLVLPAYLLIVNLGFLVSACKSKIALFMGILVLGLALLNSSFVGMRGEFLNFSLLFISSIIAAHVALEKKVGISDYFNIALIMLAILSVLAISLYLRSFTLNCPNPQRNVGSNNVIAANGTIKTEFDHSSLASGAQISTGQTTAVAHSVQQKDEKNNTQASGSINSTQPEIVKIPPEASSTTNSTQSINEKYSVQTKSEGTSIYNALFEHNFLYIVGPIPSYSYFLNYPWPSHYWGMWTFYGLYNGINELAVFILHAPLFDRLKTPTFYAPVTRQGPYNSTNYLTYIHSDFGFSGILLISFFVGLISGYFFMQAIKFKKMIDIQITTLILAGLILSIRGMISNGPYFWFLLFLMTFQWLFLKSKINKNHI
ncbi:MAG: hypothetical protein SFW66_05965 [Gammaproteobacteria bacterium]|nr:hypothetical protein [Gammaproteobacteria bacterium]